MKPLPAAPFFFLFSFLTPTLHRAACIISFRVQQYCSLPSDGIKFKVYAARANSTCHIVTVLLGLSETASCQHYLEPFSGRVLTVARTDPEREAPCSRYVHTVHTYIQYIHTYKLPQCSSSLRFVRCISSSEAPLGCVPLTDGNRSPALSP